MTARPELKYREEFTAALLDRNPSAHPPGLDDMTARRFRVYRNNVHGALIDALGDAYPVVRQLVGDDFFAAMAREFFLNETVRAPSLALYGAGFAQFIDQFPPAASVAYLADIARLERAWLESLHAENAPVVQASDLSDDLEQLDHAQFQSHPALRLVSSNYPIASIWNAHQEHAVQNEIIDQDEHALVTRPELTVQVIQLDAATAKFTHTLVQGKSVQHAFANASSEFPEFNVGHAFSQLLESGAFTRVSFKQENIE